MQGDYKKQKTQEVFLQVRCEMANKEITPREVIFDDRRTLEEVIKDLKKQIEDLKKEGE